MQESSRATFDIPTMRGRGTAEEAVRRNGLLRPRDNRSYRTAAFVDLNGHDANPILCGKAWDASTSGVRRCSKPCALTSRIPHANQLFYAATTQEEIRPATESKTAAQVRQARPRHRHRRRHRRRYLWTAIRKRPRRSSATGPGIFLYDSSALAISKVRRAGKIGTAMVPMADPETVPSSDLVQPIRRRLRRRFQESSTDGVPTASTLCSLAHPLYRMGPQSWAS